MELDGVRNILHRGSAPPALIDTLFQVVRVLTESKVEHLIVGGVAGVYWGRSKVPAVGCQLSFWKFIILWALMFENGEGYRFDRE